MKFGEYLQRHLTPEWCSQYIPYEDMKDILTDVMNKIPLNNSNLSREQYFIQADEEFFLFCEKEASKINTFFAEKLAEAILQFDLLKNELESLEKRNEERHLSFTNSLYKKIDEINIKTKRSNTINQPKKLKCYRYKKLNDLKLAFSEFYLMIILLKNYQTLNYTGFCKILKKHDKLFETTRGDQWRILYVDCTPFYTSKRVDKLMNEVEILFTNVLENGDRTKAMQRLRVPPLEEKQPRIVTFRLGFFLGMLCLLIPILFIVSGGLYNSNSIKKLNWSSAVHLYRSSFFIIIHIIFFGLNVYGWSKSGVNHVLIFEMDPRNHLTYQKFLEIGIFLMVIWFISFNIFLITFYFDKYPFIQPISLIIFLLIFFLNPFPIFYRQSRIWFLKKLFRVFFSPFYHVEFSDFWIGDQLCSLELVFFDIEYFICFYINGSNISSSEPSNILFCNGWSQVLLQSFFQNLPSWFRFIQCIRRYRDTKQKFPHLVNAGKYSSTFFVSITNALRRVKTFDYHKNKLENPFLYLWILTSFISSTYKLIWDIKMDWGLFNNKSKENKYLRQQIIYSKKLYYYLAILMDIILRYIWIINIFIHFNSLFAEYSDIIGFSFAFIEIFRRFIWNFFRLENEHLNNCGQFRAVRDISIRPTIITNNNNNLPISQITTTDNQDLSESIENNIINEIPMNTINDYRRRKTRRKTNAEEFIDEINNVLIIQPNLQINNHDQDDDSSTF